MKLINMSPKKIARAGVAVWFVGMAIILFGVFPLVAVLTASLGGWGAVIQLLVLIGGASVFSEWAWRFFAGSYWDAKCEETLRGAYEERYPERG